MPSEGRVRLISQKILKDLTKDKRIMSRFLVLHTWLLLLSWALGTGFGFLSFSYKLRDKYLTSAAKRLHQNQNSHTACFYHSGKSLNWFYNTSFPSLYSFLFVRVFWLCACLCTTGTQWHKRALGSLELELRGIVSCQVGAGTQTQTVWKSNHCSFPLSSGSGHWLYI